MLICRYVTGPGEQAEPEELPPLAGLVLLCAAPATGNNDLVKRVARKSLVRAAKMTWYGSGTWLLYTAVSQSGNVA